jgi:hypothetical protein
LESIGGFYGSEVKKFCFLPFKKVPGIFFVVSGRVALFAIHLGLHTRNTKARRADIILEKMKGQIAAGD